VLGLVDMCTVPHQVETTFLDMHGKSESHRANGVIRFYS
jgi:hypothetical protein